MTHYSNVKYIPLTFEKGIYFWESPPINISGSFLFFGREGEGKGLKIQLLGRGISGPG